MYRNHLKAALRNLSKNKVFSFINIMGLAVGLGAFMLIWQFVRFERNFDDFHELKDDIYRVQYDRIYTDHVDASAGLAAGGGPGLYRTYPEIVSFTKMWSASFMTNQLTVGDETFLPDKIYYADSAFFEIFSYEMLEGDRNTVLDEASHLVLSESMAKRIYGRTDVVGETMRVNNGYDINTLYEVSGVFKDLPADTHFEFDMLLSFQSLVNASEGSAAETFGWNAFPTYLQLSPGTDPKALEAKFDPFIKENYASLFERGVGVKLSLMPLQDIYLKSDIRFETGPSGNEKAVNILSGISILILVLAYFNYVNLSTSKSIERAKEIGVRKVNGASKVNLILQFLNESFLLNLLGLVLGFTLMQTSIPLFEEMLGRPLMQLASLDAHTIILFTVLLFGGTLLSGFYPAWVLSQTKTLKVLKGQKGVEGKDGFIRKGLVVLQFTILGILFIGSLAVRSQVNYMLKADYGFDSEQMLVVKGPSQSAEGENRLDAFKTELLKNASITGVSNSTSIPGSEISWINNNVRRITDPIEKEVSTPFLGIDHTFIDNMDLKLLAGRNFDENLSGEEHSVLLSRRAAQAFGYPSIEAAVNQKIIDGGRERLVVGVVDDYMQGSFKDSYQPLVYRYLPFANNFLSVKLVTDDFQGAIKQVEADFSEMFPASTFQYFFLDEYFQRQFEQDRLFGNLFNFFTLLGIWISVLGLVGLTSHAVLKRRKEIGIRKVLGASVGSVIQLISRRFIYLVLIALTVALPLAYYGISTWMAGYSFAIGIQPYVFIVPIAIILFITLLTTGLLALRTAVRNPVEALRYE